jgi:hypothetical protein
LQADWFRSHKSELPTQIVQIFEDNESTPGGRARNTDLINSTVIRDESGHYKWDLQNPYVEEQITIFEERFRVEKSQGYIKAVMVQKCGGTAGFNEAKAEGDIYSKIDENGREKWYYDTSEEVRKVGWRDESKVNMGSKKVDTKKACSGWV